MGRMTISSVRAIASGVLAIWYFGKLIALVNDAGFLLWRDPDSPLYLVEYLIENQPPSYEKVILN